MRIIIEVKGGMVQNVWTDTMEPVEVDIMDWDTDDGEYDLNAARELSYETVEMKQIY